MFDIVRLRHRFYLVTAVLIAISIVALIAPPRLPFGLEFSSGSSLTVDFQEPVDTDDVREQLVSIGLAEPVIQQTGEMSFFIRTEFVEEGLVPILEEQFGPVQTTGFEGATDLVTTVSFPNPVDVEDLRAEFGRDEPDDLIIEAPTPDRIFVLSTQLSNEALEPVLQAWEEQFGPFQRTEFDTESDFVVTLDFEETVNPVTAGDALRGAGIPGSVVISVRDDLLLVSGKDLTDAERETIVSTLTDRFGEAQQAPFDFESGQFFAVSFTEPVTLEDVLMELAFFPITEAVGDQAVVRRAGPGQYLVTGANLTAAQGQQIRSRLEDALGPVDVTSFDEGGDLAITLDFGPAVDFQTFRVEATSRGLDDVVTDAFSDTRFSIVSEGVTPEQREDLFPRLEERFGLARSVTYEDEGDMSIILDFQEATQRSEVIAETQNLGIPTLLVSQLGENRIFLGAKLVTPDAQEFVVDGLRARFGPAELTQFDHENGFAALLEYGPEVTLDGLRREIRRAGFQDMLVTPGVDTAFVLAAKGFGAEAQDELVSSLEAALGRAKLAPFDFAAAQLFAVRFTDPDAFAQAVRQDLIVQDAGEAGFFLAGNRLTTAQQERIFSALTEAFGVVLESSFDFGSDIAVTLAFEQPVSEEALRQRLEPFGYTDLAIEPRGGGLFIRGARPLDDQRSTIVRALEELAPVDRESLEFSSVDAEIARRSILNTFWAVLAGTGGILAYVWWAFRRVHRPFRFGVAAILALVHDIVIVLGAFGIMAKFLNVEINSLMIVGILAVIGYSVNNTIVVFDRIRENVVRHAGREFEVSVNVSLNETLTRNLNTSLTTGTAILAVILFGGPTIRDFMLVLLIGIMAGTYSSLFLAANFLVSWEKGELRRLLRPFGSRRASA